MAIDVSVIITVYNKSLYLEECLTSLINQTKNDIEIIAVDDGSTDESLSILERYSQQFPVVKVVSQKNKGLAGARITGILHAEGKYIGFVDADDFVKPQMYEILFDLAENEQADLVYCDYECYPKKSASKAKWFREYTGERNWKFIDKNTTFWSKLIRRDLLDRINIVDLLNEYGEYSPIAAMLEAEKIAFTREKLYFYRMGHPSMSGGNFVGKVEHYYEGVVKTRSLKKIIAGKPYEKDMSEYFDYRYIYTLILLALVAAKNKDKQNFDYAAEELKRLQYRKNRYTFPAVKESYGALKAFVLTQIIPLNYNLSSIIANQVI